jgi:hypothetical protein
MIVPFVEGGSLTLLNNAESQSSGTTVTTGNSSGTDANAFTAVSIGTNMTATFDSTHPAHGTNAFKFDATTATTAADYVEWDSTVIGTLTQIKGAIYFYSTVIAPNSTCRMIQWFSGSTLRCGLGLTSGTGNVQWRTGDSAVGTGSSALSSNTLYRFEFDITFSATVGSLFGRVFAGDSTTQIGADVTAPANQNLGADFNKFRVGITTANGHNAAWTLWVDSININDTAMPGPGPYTLGPPPTPSLASSDRVNFPKFILAGANV